MKLTAVHVESLRKKVKTLQTENDQMASSVQRIATEMGEGQDREDNLVTSCIDNLLQMNYSILFLREELDAKMELIARQQEEINSYSEQILAVEAKAKKVRIQKATYQGRLYSVSEIFKSYLCVNRCLHGRIKC